MGVCVAVSFVEPKTTCSEGDVTSGCKSVFLVGHEIDLIQRGLSGVGVFFFSFLARLENP